MARQTCDVEVRIHYETDDAFLVSTDGEKENAKWVPKRINGEEYTVDEGEKGWAVLTVPEWWAAEKELI